MLRYEKKKITPQIIINMNQKLLKCYLIVMISIVKSAVRAKRATIKMKPKIH